MRKKDVFVDIILVCPPCVVEVILLLHQHDLHVSSVGSSCLVSFMANIRSETEFPSLQMPGWHNPTCKVVQM